MQQFRSQLQAYSHSKKSLGMIATLGGAHMAWFAMCANALADFAKNTMSAPPKLLIAVAVSIVLLVVFFGRMDMAFEPAPGDRARYLYNGVPLDGPTSPVEVNWLEQRKRVQVKSVDRLNVLHDFEFQDRLTESQITFMHRVVDDAGRDYKAIHYDHGNGLAVADVDGDGLRDLYFVNQLGSSELWRNLGRGQFENITQSANVGLADRIGVSASFADIDNDGDPDLYVTTVRTGNVLFENLGKGRFKDITAGAGLAYSGHSSGAVFFDYNRDGRVDLFLTNVGHYTTDQKGRGGYFVGMSDGFTGHLHGDRSERCILYENLGKNRFLDVTEKVGLRDFGWSGDASFADLNEDGFPDLYVLSMQGNDHFFENAQGRHFIDKTDVYFPRTPWGSMGIKFFDYNNDGLLDLFLTDMHSDMSDDIDYDDFAREKLKSVMKWDKAVLKGYEKSIWGNALSIRTSETGSSLRFLMRWGWRTTGRGESAWMI